MNEVRTTLKDKLAKLLKNIEQNRYTSTDLDDLNNLQERLAQDIGLGVDTDQAMALLGYLLKHDYVKINPDSGIILNEKNDEIKAIRNML